MADKIATLGNTATTGSYRTVLGKINPESKQVERAGLFFTWLDQQVPRPTFISELTPAHLTAWRASWRFADTTARTYWVEATNFFNFCEKHGWFRTNPATNLKKPKIAKGNRTAIFTDDQYKKILAAIPLYHPVNVPDATYQNWMHRLTAFIELMRWSGMDLIDAVHFSTDKLDKDGVLRYHRQKTGELATVTLPERVIVLLRDIPLERGSVGPGLTVQAKRHDRCD